MKIHIVMVQIYSGPRYQDSFWVEEERANARRDALRESFKRQGYELRQDRHWIWTHDAVLQDAEIGKRIAAK